jgi:thiamine phosphate synthase YjbQ (UPF0047 family)
VLISPDGTKGSRRSRGCDVTDAVSRGVADAAPAAGIATVFITGSTDAVTTIEYERGAVADFNTLLERLAPRDADYRPTTGAWVVAADP